MNNRSHPKNGGPAYTGVQTNYVRGATNQTYPSVHAPWYGYLLFAHAAQGGEDGTLRFVRTKKDKAFGSCSAAIKVFALKGGDVPSMGQSGRTVRLAAVNKDLTKWCSVTLTVEGSWGEGLAVWLQPGGKGLMSKTGVTWRSQGYEGTSNGTIAGQGLMQKYKGERVELAASTAAGGGAAGGGGAGAGARGRREWTRYALARLGPGQAVVITAQARA
jgi:hypothetical protein